MAEILHQLSDDQIAISICFAGVVVSGLIMHFSHFVGRLSGRTNLSAPAISRQQTLSLQSGEPAQPERRIKAA